MNSEMKNCPKCGSRAVDFVRDKSGMWHVKCFACDFTYTTCLSMKQVLETWNKAFRVKEEK